MIPHPVPYTAVCPGCGQDAEWTTRVVQHRNSADTIACDVACVCPEPEAEVSAA